MVFRAPTLKIEFKRMPRLRRHITELMSAQVEDGSRLFWEGAPLARLLEACLVARNKRNNVLGCIRKLRWLSSLSDLDLTGLCMYFVGL